MERLGDVVERNAVLCLGYEGFLQPELLLEVLNLSEEVDDLAGQSGG